MQFNLSEYIHKSNPNIIEAGAGNGEDIVDLARIFPNGKLYTFEPNIDQYHIVKNTLNQHHISNVELYGNALGEETGLELDFHVSDRFGEPWGSSSLMKPKEHLNGAPDITFNKTIKVTTVNLDDFIKKKGIEVIDYLELDLQGYEPEIVKSSPLTISKTKYFLTEINTKETYENNMLYPEYKEMLLSMDFEIINESFEGMQGNVLLVNKKL